MNPDTELIDRLRRCPVGYWSTDDLLPMGCVLVIRSDGTGVMSETGFGGYDVRFNWHLDPNGAFEVRLTGRDDGAEMDAEFFDWHSSPYQVSPETHSWTGKVLPAIEFWDGVLHLQMAWMLIERVPLLYGGEVPATAAVTE